jgi:hypothetical protein
VRSRLLPCSFSSKIALAVAGSHARVQGVWRHQGPMMKTVSVFFALRLELLCQVVPFGLVAVKFKIGTVNLSNKELILLVIEPQRIDVPQMQRIRSLHR